MLLAVVAMSSCSQAFAGTWNFQELVNEACVNYPSVLSKVAAKEAASADLSSAQWQQYPAPSLESTSDREGNTNFVLRVEEILWAGGGINGAIDSARMLREASEKGIREAQYDVVSRVIDAYVEAMHQQARRSISRRNLEEHRLLDDAIKRRVASEISPLVDEELSRSRLAQASNDLESVEQALAKSLHLLSQLSGKNVTEAVPVAAGSIPLPDDLEGAIQDAVAKSPTLARLADERAAADAQIRVKKAAYWPTLALRYEKSLNNNNYYYGMPSDNRIMVVLEAQPGAGLSAYSGVASAVAKRDAAEQDRRSSQRDLQRLIEDTWQDLEVARRQLRFASSARTSAEQVAESYKRQYIIGHKSWLDVLNVVREATQSQLYVADADAQVALASLRIALLTDRLHLEKKK
jgi:outer membrane protein, adhesin transport system